MTGNLLFVDDDPKALAGYERSFCREPLMVTTATSGAQALARLTQGEEFDVIVSDLRMPGMDGIELLSKVAAFRPDTFRILLTGAADLQTAVAAVNQAGIFRLLLKPCPAEALVSSVREAVRLRSALGAEKELLEQTVTGSVALCMDLLAAIDPYALRHGERLLQYARRVSKAAELREPWRLQLAAMLSPIGFVALPNELKQAIAQNAPLREDQRERLREVPLATHRLLCHIPRLEPVADIVLRAQSPQHECPKDLWLEADILAVLLRLAAETSDSQSEAAALAAMKPSSEEGSPGLELVRRVFTG